MDDKDKLITVSHNSGDSSPETENKPDDNMPLNESEDVSFPEPDNSQPVNRVEYDSFMYEPIGFEELERQNQEKHREAAEKAEKRHRTRNERLIILLLAMIFLFTILLSVACIVLDIGKSSNAVRITSGNGQNVVIYRQSKPEGANDAENFKDENGKYVRRERYAGSVSRSFYVGENITENEIHPKYENGILTFSLPRKDRKAIEEKKHYISIEG